MLLTPQTYMNESGDSAGPARGALRIPLDQVIAVHDEIDLPFGEIRAKLGGGVAGHNGLKSLKRGFGSTDFWRVRAGVGRPDSTDPEIEYYDLIQVMDAIRSTDKPLDGVPALASLPPDGSGAHGAQAGDVRPERVALFTDIALGDAP